MADTSGTTPKASLPEMQGIIARRLAALHLGREQPASDPTPAPIRPEPKQPGRFGAKKPTGPIPGDVKVEMGSQSLLRWLKEEYLKDNNLKQSDANGLLKAGLVSPTKVATVGEMREYLVTLQEAAQKRGAKGTSFVNAKALVTGGYQLAGSQSSTLYRADSRIPGMVKNKDGFSLKEPGNKARNLQWLAEMPIEAMRSHIANGSNLGLISTAADIECGGYGAGRYVYRIEIDTDLNRFVPATGEDRSNMAKFPVVYTNASDIGGIPDASWVAVDPLVPTAEIDFFQTIPLDMIKAVRPIGRPDFTELKWSEIDAVPSPDWTVR
jgi:hypothetical protein